MLDELEFKKSFYPFRGLDFLDIRKDPKSSKLKVKLKLNGKILVTFVDSQNNGEAIETLEKRFFNGEIIPCYYTFPPDPAYSSPCISIDVQYQNNLVIVKRK